MTLLDLGVVGTSTKENEYRLPLHPEHLSGLDADLRARITLEHGYGERFGVSDAPCQSWSPGSPLGRRSSSRPTWWCCLSRSTRTSDCFEREASSGAGRTASRTPS